MGWPSEENKTDSYSEAFTGLGTSRDRSTFARAKHVALMLEGELTDMYLGDGFARRIVDSVAEEMTRAGFELEGIDEETAQAVMSKLQLLDANQHYNQALQWSRLFGGSLIIIGANDGGTLETPLNVEGVKNVEFLRVYDRFQATIKTRVTDTYSMDYGKPELWNIAPATGGNPYVVHHSRVQVFDGEAVPDRIRQQNEGWGASVLQSCFAELVRLGTSFQWVNALLERNQQAVQKIPGLSNLLKAPGGKEAIAARVDVVDMVRGILNTVVIDEKEDYSISVQSLAGVCDVLDRMMQAVSAVSGIPVFVLFGQGKGGLNNTNAGELESWNARVGAMQNDQLRKPEDQLVSMILQTMDKGDGGNYTLKFCPLYVPSEKEQAETEKLEAEKKKIEMETATGYINAQCLDANEVRPGLVEDYEHIDLSQDVSLPEEPDDDPASLAVKKQQKKNAKK